LLVTDVELLRGPTELAVNEVENIVHHAFKNVVDLELSRFPGLQKECKVHLQSVIENSIKELRDRVKEMIEIEKNPFTLDPRFQKLYEEAINPQAPDQAASLSSSVAKWDSSKDRTKTMILMLRCYIEVLHDTFRESAAKRIRHAAIAMVQMKSELALEDIIANSAGEKCDELLQEADDVCEERKRLEATLDILRQASRKISEIS
jgi:hypothetical protein